MQNTLVISDLFDKGNNYSTAISDLKCLKAKLAIPGRFYLYYFVTKNGGIQNKHSFSSSANFLHQLLSLHAYLISRHKNLSLLTQYQILNMHCLVALFSCIHITYIKIITERLSSLQSLRTMWEQTRSVTCIASELWHWK